MWRFGADIYWKVSSYQNAQNVLRCGLCSVPSWIGYIEEETVVSVHGHLVVRSQQGLRRSCLIAEHCPQVQPSSDGGTCCVHLAAFYWEKCSFSGGCCRAVLR